MAANTSPTSAKIGAIQICLRRKARVDDGRLKSERTFRIEVMRASDLDCPGSAKESPPLRKRERVRSIPLAPAPASSAIGSPSVSRRIGRPLRS